LYMVLMLRPKTLDCPHWQQALQLALNGLAATA